MLFLIDHCDHGTFTVQMTPLIALTIHSFPHKNAALFSVFFARSFVRLGQWDGGTQEKHVQVGCLVQGFVPKNVEL